MDTAPDNQQPIFRLCKTCGEVKPIENFAVYDAKLGKRRHHCGDCRRQYLASWARGEVVPRHVGDYRTCVVCGTEKHVDEFAVIYCQKRRGTKYRGHTCLVCKRVASAEKQRKARAENPEKWREISRRHNAKHSDAYGVTKRAYHQKIREVVFAAYGGFKCQCCSETEPTMLTIDHVNNDGAEHRRSLRNDGSRSANIYPWLIKNGFPEGFQVLCYNCNISKYRNGGICAHQTKAGSTTRE